MSESGERDETRLAARRAGAVHCGGCGRKSPELDLVHEESTSNALLVQAEADWKQELRRRR